MDVRARVLSPVQGVGEDDELLVPPVVSGGTGLNGASLSQALQALTVIARLHHVPCDAAALLHRLGKSATDPAAVSDLLLAAKQLGLRAKHVKTAPERLPLTPLPALALMRDGSIAVLAQCNGQRVLLQRFVEGAEQRPSYRARRGF